jgi:hypothetical protein
MTALNTLAALLLASAGLAAGIVSLLKPEPETPVLEVPARFTCEHVGDEVPLLVRRQYFLTDTKTGRKYLAIRDFGIIEITEEQR